MSHRARRHSAPRPIARAVVAPRPVGVLLGLQGSRNPFTTCPSYREIAALPLTERVARLRTPELRARLLSEIAQSPIRRDHDEPGELAVSCGV